MDTFSAKKLGEVLAFSRVGVDTLDKGGAALARVLGESSVEGLRKGHEQHIEAIEKAAEAAEEDSKQTTFDKAKATGEKLENMRELYLQGDDWNDPVEVMEWLGFFEGAAIVHWSLVQGAAAALDESDLAELAEQGVAFHREFFDTIAEKIQGANRFRE